MRSVMITMFAALTLLPLLANTGSAQERRRDDRRGEDRRFEDRRFEEERFHDRDIARFRDRDFDVWRRGGWIQGNHGGRFGWWWVVNGNWYLYPEPIYPYPDPYVPPVAAIPALAPGATYWYYCANPRGYYPYVARCLAPWRAVPAQ